MAPMYIREFPALLEMVQMIERLKLHPSRVMKLHHNGFSCGSSGGRNKAHQQKPYSRPQHSKSVAFSLPSQKSSQGSVDVFNAIGRI